MKLYATTTSERASKGQGGNERLNIDITDEFGQIILTINAKITGNIVSFNNRNWITNKVDNFTCKIQTKGEKQKKAKCGHRLCDIDNVCTE